MLIFHSESTSLIPPVFALFMLLGFFATLLIPETKGMSLEDLSNEDQSDFVGGSKIAHVREERSSGSL